MFKLNLTFSVSTIYGDIDNIKTPIAIASSVNEIFPPLATAAGVNSTTTSQANWTLSTRATAYLLYASIDNFTTKLTGFDGLNVGNVTTYPISGIPVNTTVKYKLKATDGAETSGYSNPITSGTLPEPPSVSSASSITNTGFTANWSTVTGITDFKLYVYNNLGVVLDDYNGIAVTGVSQAVTGLTSGGNYTYKLISVGAYGDSALSSAQPVSTTVSAPTANSPSLVTVSGFTANWSTVTGATYLFYAYDSSGVVLGDYNGIAVVGTSIPVTGQSADTLNSFKVKAVINGNQSVFSNTQGPFYTLPATPTVSAESSVTASGFTANYSAGANRLYVYDNLGAVLSLYNGITVAGTSQAVTGLSELSNYTYKVSKVSHSQESALSSAESVTTEALPPGITFRYLFNEGSGSTSVNSANPGNNNATLDGTWSTNSLGQPIFIKTNGNIFYAVETPNIFAQITSKATYFISFRNPPQGDSVIYSPEVPAGLRFNSAAASPMTFFVMINDWADIWYYAESDPFDTNIFTDKLIIAYSIDLDNDTLKMALKRNSGAVEEVVLHANPNANDHAGEADLTPLENIMHYQHQFLGGTGSNCQIAEAIIYYDTSMTVEEMAEVISAMKST